MPRFAVRDDDGGTLVPGIYGRLLERERRACNEIDPRRALAARHGGKSVFHRPRGLLEALEAGADVVLGRRSAEARYDFRFRLPWDRAVRSVRVSPDDVVRPTDERHPWYGRAAGLDER